MPGAATTNRGLLSYRQQVLVYDSVNGGVRREENPADRRAWSSTNEPGMAPS